eukprot:2504683-Pyramimonas_sp.AAC.2
MAYLHVRGSRTRRYLYDRVGGMGFPTQWPVTSGEPSDGAPIGRLPIRLCADRAGAGRDEARGER